MLGDFWFWFSGGRRCVGFSPLPTRLKIKERCGSNILICNLSQFCLICHGGAFRFVKSHCFQRSGSWALGSVWVDLVAGEQEKGCSVERTSDWRFYSQRSSHLDKCKWQCLETLKRWYFQLGRIQAWCLRELGSLMQITSPVYAFCWRNLK